MRPRQLPLDGAHRCGTDMTIKGPSDDLNGAALVSACSDALEDDFNEVRDQLIASGIDAFDVAQELLVGDEHPHLAPIAADAMTAGWRPDIVRRAMLSLSSWNKEEAFQRRYGRGP